jgi:hypothetical protein
MTNISSLKRDKMGLKSKRRKKKSIMPGIIRGFKDIRDDLFNNKPLPDVSNGL